MRSCVMPTAQCHVSDDCDPDALRARRRVQGAACRAGSGEWCAGPQKSHAPTRSHALHFFAERRKQDAVAAVAAATGAAMDAINGGAATVWHNQQQLEAEARVLHQQAQRLSKQSAQWAQSYQAFHQALKQLGDVENWAKAIESDMAFIHSSLDELASSRAAAAAPPPPAAID